ncbi:MAG: hypothetical protein IJ139_02200 [Bacteroidaceae bacterium]|nr:hypothetical protein [Bacteroidaceae bacterium]
MRHKVILLLGLVVLSMHTLNTSAQDKYLFNHVAVGVEAGTTGFGVELSAPLTHYLTLRTGFTTMPQFSYDDDVRYTSHGNPEKVNVEGKLHMSDWKLLAELYPFRNKGFHLTAGFYVGKEEMITAENTEDIKGLEPNEGIEIGDYLVRPDQNGVARANLKVKSFKPYLGIGWGRSISEKHRLGMAFDMGVQFWGEPSVNAFSPDDNQWVKVHTTDTDVDDLNKALDTIAGIKVWPVLSLRLTYRIF